MGGVAATGGVIGIGLFEYTTCGKERDETVRAMPYVAHPVGVKHGALRSVFERAMTVVLGSGGVVLLPESSLKAGFTEVEISGI